MLNIGHLRSGFSSIVEKSKAFRGSAETSETFSPNGRHEENSAFAFCGSSAFYPTMKFLMRKRVPKGVKRKPRSLRRVCVELCTW